MQWLTVMSSSRLQFTTSRQLVSRKQHFMDPRRSFPALMDSARAWARHHNCKVTVDVDQDPPMWDEHGRTIPFGWRIGDAA